MHWLQSSTTSKSRTKSVVVSQISMKCPTEWELQIRNVRRNRIAVTIKQKSFNNHVKIMFRSKCVNLHTFSIEEFEWLLWELFSVVIDCFAVVLLSSWRIHWRLATPERFLATTAYFPDCLGPQWRICRRHFTPFSSRSANKMVSYFFVCMLKNAKVSLVLLWSCLVWVCVLDSFFLPEIAVYLFVVKAKRKANKQASKWTSKMKGA